MKRKRISLALSIALAMHVILMAVFVRFLDPEARVPVGLTLKVTYETHQRVGDGVQGAETSSAVEVESAPKESVAREMGEVEERQPDGGAEPAAMTSRVAQATEESPATVDEAENIGGLDIEKLAEVVAKEVPIQSGEVVTAVNTDAQAFSTEHARAVQPPVTRHALEADESKMLQRKVRKWSENLLRKPELMEGTTWEHKGQRYSATFTKEPAEDDMDIGRLVVEISTVVDGERLSSRVHLKQLSFSSYAQFVDRWDPAVSLHDDVLDGRFHSNSEITLARTRTAEPRFHGLVTTASRRINYSDWRGAKRRDKVFLGGLQRGVRPIRLPKGFEPFPETVSRQEASEYHFQEDARITFRPDGSFLAQAINGDAPSEVTNHGERAYLIADRKVKLSIKGVVNGQVLVYSPDRVVIEGSLVYAEDPEVHPGSDDYLGIVSDKSVEIAQPDQTGPGDLTIQAAIFAKRRFVVRRYRKRENALLYIFGSLSAGSITATEPRYATKIRFDRRLEELRPPGFPVTDRYEAQAWDPFWTVDSPL